MGNAAQRLHDLLTQIRKCPDDLTAEEAWSRVLEVERGNLAVLLRQMAKVIELPYVIREQIARQPIFTPDIALKGLLPIENAFRELELKRQIHQFKSKLDEKSLYSLEVCSDLLSRNFPEPECNQAELNNILGKLNKLQDQIQKSSMRADLKLFLLDLLAKAQWAIRDYRIRGSTALREAVQNALGAAVVNKELAEETAKHEEGKAFWAALNKIAIVVQITLGALQIGESVLKMIPETSETIIEIKDEQIQKLEVAKSPFVGDTKNNPN